VVFTFKQNGAAADDLVKRFAGVVAVRADQEDISSITAMFQPVRDGLDILVNNASINPRTPIADITAEEFDQVMTVNVKFPLLAATPSTAPARARWNSSPRWPARRSPGRPRAVCRRKGPTVLVYPLPPRNHGSSSTSFRRSRFFGPRNRSRSHVSASYMARRLPSSMMYISASL
jgi:NAD(P)-dependent dehydrogenase (short-subunit alcohol dehydrogenase family)